MITRWPRKADKLTLPPSASVSVKSGAWSPGASRTSLTCDSFRSAPTVPASRPPAPIRRPGGPGRAVLAGGAGRAGAVGVGGAAAGPPDTPVPATSRPEQGDRGRQAAERPAAVADRVFLGRGHLSRRALVAVRHEDRVIAEPVRSPRFADQVSYEGALAQRLLAGREHERRHAAEVRAAPLIGDVAQLSQHQVQVL